MEQGNKMTAKYFTSADSLARFVNLNKIEQHQIVQIVKTSTDGLYLFFYRDIPLEFDLLRDLFDRTFINELHDNKGCLVRSMGKEGCYVIPTSLKDNGQNLSGEEWIEILCKFNDTDDYLLVH
jgi:hypothetical protein